MYNAHATVQDDDHNGSTRLHLDLTDAVNIMIWTADIARETLGYALWHIFAAADLPVLRQFLMEQGIFRGKGDPVHSQTVCLTPKLLQLLFDKYGIRPYIIHQYLGQAVYIPAGCAHQVRYSISLELSCLLTPAQVTNITDAIKIACDFICIANLPATQKLRSEFHEHRLATNSGDDVLQLHNILWWACVWLSEQPWSLVTVEANNPTEDPPMADVDEDIVMVDISGSSSIDTSSSTPVQGVDLRTAAQRKLAKYNQRRKEKLLRRGGKVNTEHKEGCPICPRKFHRNGVINHL